MTNNHVVLTGNIGAKPKFIQHDKRTFVAFSLATQDRYQDKDQNWKTMPTVWHQILVFNSNLIDAAQKLDKGMRVKITGSLQYRSFDALLDNEQTIKKNEASIVAASIEHAPIAAAQPS